MKIFKGAYNWNQRTIHMTYKNLFLVTYPVDDISDLLASILHSAFIFIELFKFTVIYH